MGLMDRENCERLIVSDTIEAEEALDSRTRPACGSKRTVWRCQQAYPTLKAGRLPNGFAAIRSIVRYMRKIR
jgi:hypothetical protein